MGEKLLDGPVSHLHINQGLRRQRLCRRQVTLLCQERGLLKTHARQQRNIVYSAKSAAASANASAAATSCR